MPNLLLPTIGNSETSDGQTAAADGSVFPVVGSRCGPELTGGSPGARAPAVGTLEATPNRHGGDTVQLTLTRTPEPEIAQIDVTALPVVASGRITPTSTEHASTVDIVEEWGLQSFPASDPPANW